MKLERIVPPEVLAAIRAPLLEAPAQWLHAPVAQELAPYLDLAGESMRERLFMIQTPGGQEACLRPDFTLAAVQAHLATGDRNGRYVYEGPAFRVAPSGIERAEEFLQIGVEAFNGADTPAVEADAGILALAWRSAFAGGRADLSMVLGDVSLLGAFLRAMEVPAAVALRLQRALGAPGRVERELQTWCGDPLRIERPGAGERLARLLSPLPPEEAAAVLADVWALAGIEPVGGRTAADIAHRLAVRADAAAAPPPGVDQVQRLRSFLEIAGEPHAALSRIDQLAGDFAGVRKGVEAWRGRLAALEQAGAPLPALRFETALGRPFGYYDGLLFEVRSRALGDDQPVAAGGRYDGLLARYGGPAGRAVGCSVRPFRAWKEGGA